MVAVGLWGAFLGPPAIWLLPVTFPLVMALGGALGVAGVPIPGIEVGIAASALIVGAAVLLACARRWSSPRSSSASSRSSTATPTAPRCPPRPARSPMPPAS